MQAWVYRRNDGTGVIPEEFEIMQLLNTANEILKANNVNIQFYLVCSVICRVKNNSITRTQKAIMYFSLDNDSPINNGYRIIYNNNDIDEYENDNHFMVANEVDISRFPRRHHTFHRDSGSWGSPEACDEDWIKFNLNTTRNVIAVTRPAPVAANLQANTTLELYRQIANPDGTIGNGFTRNEISIYPNPVSNQLTIKLPSVYNQNPTQVELYNSIGQLVLSKTYTETTIEFSVSSFPKGLYVLKIQNGEEMKTEKIIIE